VKDWLKTIGVLLVIWVLINLLTTGAYIFSGAVVLGETTFWEAFVNLSLAELAAFGGIALIIAAMTWFIKGIRKGLKEEKKRYGKTKHNKPD
jgi:hypothetical protein